MTERGARVYWYSYTLTISYLFFYFFIYLFQFSCLPMHLSCVCVYGLKEWEIREKLSERERNVSDWTTRFFNGEWLMNTNGIFMVICNRLKACCTIENYACTISSSVNYQVIFEGDTDTSSHTWNQFLFCFFLLIWFNSILSVIVISPHLTAHDILLWTPKCASSIVNGWNLRYLYTQITFWISNWWTITIFYKFKLIIRYLINKHTTDFVNSIIFFAISDEYFVATIPDDRASDVEFE